LAEVQILESQRVGRRESRDRKFRPRRYNESDSRTLGRQLVNLFRDCVPARGRNFIESVEDQKEVLSSEQMLQKIGIEGLR
jgi:hypothetical protein